MFEKIKSFFTPDRTPEPEEVEIPEEPEPEEVEIPDEVEIVWKVVAPLKNIDLEKTKNREQLKELLYEAKMAEKNIFDRLQKYKEMELKILNKIHEAYKVPTDGSYDLILPSMTGKSGYFKKKK